jgi:hypothetical protein
MTTGYCVALPVRSGQISFNGKPMLRQGGGIYFL